MTPHYAHYGGNLDPNPFSCAAAIITAAIIAAAEAEAEPKHPPTDGTDQPVGNGTDFWPLLTALFDLARSTSVIFSY